VKAGNRMWNETTKANCRRDRKVGSNSTAVPSDHPDAGRRLARPYGAD
jgi:hypothetical protein